MTTREEPNLPVAPWSPSPHRCCSYCDSRGKGRRLWVGAVGYVCDEPACLRMNTQKQHWIERIDPRGWIASINPIEVEERQYAYHLLVSEYFADQDRIKKRAIHWTEVGF